MMMLPTTADKRPSSKTNQLSMSPTAKQGDNPTRITTRVAEQ